MSTPPDYDNPKQIERVVKACQLLLLDGTSLNDLWPMLAAFGLTVPQIERVLTWLNADFYRKQRRDGALAKRIRDAWFITTQEHEGD